MDRERVEEIVRLAQRSPVVELRVCEDGLEVRVVKAAAVAEAPATEAPATPVESPVALAPVSDTVTIRATKVGFFHRGTGPGASPLVAIGDHVHVGQAIATLESLRRPTDVTAEVAGEIIAAMVEDGSAVEYGQPLFEIRPGQGAGEDVGA